MAKVPNIFHFVFGLRPQTEPFHILYYLCLASCLEVNRPEAIMFHYYHQPWGEWWERIAPSLQLNKIEPDQFVASFKYPNPEFERFRYAHLADITRLEMIIKYGGIYADMDTLFVNPLPQHFFEQPFIMGREKVDWTAKGVKEIKGSLCNAWIMGEAESEFAKLWLDKTYEIFGSSWSGHSTFLPYQISLEHPEWIHIEPERSFFAFDWTREGLSFLFEQSLKSSTEDIYSIHLWNHLWWNKERIDFTFFHEGRLTPEYIRYSSVAYAKLANPFLPTEAGLDHGRYIQQQWLSLFENAGIRLNKRFRKLLKRRGSQHV